MAGCSARADRMLQRTNQASSASKALNASKAKPALPRSWTKHWLPQPEHWGLHRSRDQCDSARSQPCSVRLYPNPLQLKERTRKGFCSVPSTSNGTASASRTNGGAVSDRRHRAVPDLHWQWPPAAPSQDQGRCVIGRLTHGFSLHGEGYATVAQRIFQDSLARRRLPTESAADDQTRTHQAGAGSSLHPVSSPGAGLLAQRPASRITSNGAPRETQITGTSAWFMPTCSP